MPIMSRRLAFLLQLSIAIGFLAGFRVQRRRCTRSIQARWGFSPITITIVFGVYALAVLAALLTLGSLSDHVGRRPVLVVAIISQAIAMLIFATASGVPSLLVARVVQGLSTGAAISGAVGAGMIDLDRMKGTIANAVGPLMGTATGAIASGLMVQYVPAPTVTIFLVLCAIFIAQAVAVTWMPETSALKPGALASLRPRFHLPPAVRAAMLLAVPAVVACWSLAGFYLSLGPTLVHRLVGSNAIALGGLAIFVFAGSGAAAVVVLRDRTPRVMATFGTSALLAGVGITLIAIAHASGPGFFAGNMIAGMGFGAAFQGAIRSVVSVAAADERAGVLSILFTLSYLAMGVPAVFAGIRVVHGGGLLVTAHEYAVVW